MKSDASQITKFMASNYVFAIPVYQRNYDWKKSHCERLFQDIVKAGQNEKIRSHFIGSIVYVEEGSHTSTMPRELTIIDGQQRLTTLTLIFAALRQEALQSGNSVLAEDLREKYLYNRFVSGDKRKEEPKLSPTENNVSPLKGVLDENQLFDSHNSVSDIVKNYKLIKSWLHNENIDVIQKGLDKLWYVEILLDRNSDDVQRIFESLNSTGEDLKQADLIRNYVLMDLPPEKQTYIYNKYWKNIEEYTKAPGSDTMVSEFIRDYLTNNNGIPNENRVYETFKKEFPSLSFNDQEALLTDLRFHAVCYGKLLDPSKEKDSDIAKHLFYIKQLKVNVAYPFLMRVYRDFDTQKINKNIFISILELVQSFVCRRFIVGLPSNAHNKIFMGLHDKVKQVENSNYLRTIENALLEREGTFKFPSNSDIEAVLQTREIYRIDSKNKRYLLERLDHFDNKESVPVNEDITIEHIFPQDPDNEWKTELPPDEYKWMQEHVHTIGNLTLSGNNGSLGNKPFLIKRDMDTNDKKQGYKYSGFWLNHDLRELEKWDKEAVENRTKRLTKRFISIWKEPNGNPDKKEKNQAISIFEADDPTGKQLDYAIFLGDRIVGNYVKLYVTVIKRLFKEQPDCFFSHPQLKNRIKITSDPDKEGQYKALDEVYFLDTHSSSAEKFSNLMAVLNACDFEEDVNDVLLIKLLEK